MSRHVRGYFPLFFLFILSTLLAAPRAGAQLVCQLAPQEVRQVRAQSRVARLADVEVTCRGGVAGNLSLMVFLPVDVVTLPDEPPAYLVVGKAAGEMVDLAQDGLPAAFDAFSGRNPIWLSVPYTPPAAEADPFRMRIVNLWFDPASAPPSGVVNIAAQVSGTVTNRPVNLAARDAAMLEADTLRVIASASGGRRVGLNLYEDATGALAPAAPLDDALTPQPQNVLGASYRSESGYMSDPAAGAGSATRVLLEMGETPGVTEFAAPGRISLLPGGAELRLISGADAGDFSGGEPAGPFDTEMYEIEPGDDGRYRALYEFVPIRGYAPQTRFAATLELTLGCAANAGGAWSGRVLFAPFAAAPPVALRAGSRTQQATPAPLPVFAPEPVAEFSIDLAEACSAPVPPVFSKNAVLNAASFRQPLAPGVMAAVFPSNLTAASYLAPAVPLPAIMDGIQVLVNDVPAPLYFTSGSQINFQVPWDAIGTSTLDGGAERGQEQKFVGIEIVRDGVGPGAIRIPIERYSPALVTLDYGPGRALAVNPDSTLAQRADRSPVPARPAKAGEVLMLFATGVGSATPAPVDGDDSTDSDGNYVERLLLARPTVLIGGVEAEVLFAGMSPQFVAVAQLNVTVPSGVSGDAVPIAVTVGGARSRSDVTIAVE